MFNSGVSDSYEEIDRDRSELRVDDVDASNDSFTVLILGIDADAERTQDGQINADNFRSDSMILATFDRENDDVKFPFGTRNVRKMEIVNGNKKLIKMQKQVKSKSGSKAKVHCIAECQES